MVSAMLEGKLCPPIHFTIQYIGKSSEAYFSKIFDLNDIKFASLVKDAIFYKTSKF